MPWIVGAILGGILVLAIAIYLIVGGNDPAPAASAPNPPAVTPTAPSVQPVPRAPVAP